MPDRVALQVLLESLTRLSVSERDAVKSFISILSDPGPAFATTKLNFTLSGDQTNIYHQLFQKRNGVFYLAIWRGVCVTTPSVGGTTNIINPDRSITLNLDTPAKTIRMYRSSTDGTNVLSTLSNTSNIPLSVPDHVLLVEISI